MKHISTFEGFLYEGFMSSLDLIAQDAKNLEDFKKKAKRDFPQIAKLEGADEWLEEIYSQAIKESVNESINVNEFAEIIFLSKYIGDYNITKYGNKLTFENAGKTLVLERL